MKSDDVAQFVGLGRCLPLTASVLAICLLSLAGFPPFGGFIGKIYLFGTALAAGLTWLAVVMLVNVAMSLFYYVRVLEPMYLRLAAEKPLQNEPVEAQVPGQITQPWHQWHEEQQEEGVRQVPEDES